MSIAPNWFPFHIGDYLRDAEELSMLQHGAYLGLMCWYYSIGRPIPAQPQRIYNRLRANSLEERAAADFILTEFFVLTGPCWTHKRIDAELAKFQREQEARERGGNVTKEKWREIKESGKAPPNASAKATPQGNQNQNQNQNQRSSKEVAPPVLRKRPRKPVEAVGSGETLISIPAIGAEVEICASAVKEWETLFPAVDIPQTLREIRAWCLANPEKRKTTGGIHRFVTRWLTKEQNHV